jgi:hypothetical protein
VYSAGLGMDLSYGADFLCKSLSKLSFKCDVEATSLDGVFGEVSVYVNGGVDGEGFIEVTSSVDPALNIEGLAFADSVVVEVIKPDVVDLRANVDSIA